MSVKEVYEGNISEGTAEALKSGGGRIVVDSPFESGEGVDSAILKVEDTEKVNSASGDYSVVIGTRNQALGTECLAAGGNAIAGRAESAPGADDGANDCFALGYRAEATGENSFVAGGYKAKATGKQSFATGRETVASATNASVFGRSSTASGECSFAEGRSTTASADYSHAEGNGTVAKSGYAHAEGHNTVAGVDGASDGTCAHAEGESTIASAKCAHAEGSETTASGEASHAEGSATTAAAPYSHAGGIRTELTSDAFRSFAHGADLYASHADCAIFGTDNKSTATCQTVVGSYSYNSVSGSSAVDTAAKFAVGAGEFENPQCCFQTGYGDPSSTGTDAHYIKIGNTVLTEAQLIALLAQLQ